MANHAFVTSRKKQSPEVINKLLAELNQRLFKGNLHIENCWDVKYVSSVDGQIYCYRSFWLENPRKFEMRHGPGGDFAWWIDNAICNEVALAYNGTISDEGVEERWKGKPNEYDDIAKFVKLMTDHIPRPAMLMLWPHMLAGFPPEFRNELGR